MSGFIDGDGIIRATRVEAEEDLRRNDLPQRPGLKAREMATLPVTELPTKLVHCLSHFVVDELIRVL